MKVKNTNQEGNGVDKMTQKSELELCPYCKNKSGRKQGKVATVSAGKKQRYLCKECGRSWYK